jgi:L-serine dehydratase
MSVSVFDLYSIGVGPSSSHTVGPMKAAYRFMEKYLPRHQEVDAVKVDLYGSLALTGKGHCTDIACLLGLTGLLPEKVDPALVDGIIESIHQNKSVPLFNQIDVDFDVDKDMEFHYLEELPHHPNGVRFSLLKEKKVLCTCNYYSIGGGFVLDEAEITASEENDDISLPTKLPYGFETWDDLQKHCHKENKSISEIMMANELVWRDEAEIKDKLLQIWQVMSDSITRGLENGGVLPGSLKVPRRASKLFQKLSDQHIPAADLNWLNVYAIAVNEENAAGGKVVTAPTNGAAGILPAVMRYYLSITPAASDKRVINYMLTTAAIGILYKKGASISAAEVGCQGEVGVACSMAAAGLCVLLGGNIKQVGNAAEMGMEHNLGLTCDPIGGLVQIPCIERNAMGSAQAVNAAKLALLGDGEHQISLDMVIATMKQTGLDMSHKYKETSLGGLAVNLPAC